MQVAGLPAVTFSRSFGLVGFPFDDGIFAITTDNLALSVARFEGVRRVKLRQ